MGAIEDVRKWLADMPLWRELGKMPDRMAAMEARMAAMEERLKTRPGETCPKCGEHSMRLADAGRLYGPIGKQERTDKWLCSGCGYSELRVVRF
ncbi:hypothetical protein [Mesorhizobium sp.]|uniref:hypothetical protein n=1 Tax=Mesorhizobium sp. TaxID=1871066 RepID=UPI000FE786DA|nr:hypothetical protein [Mesorhizobium sp.]RWN28883.1 MAG: hypothetical protein EOR95_22900 [Mesorhizobium sp.]